MYIWASGASGEDANVSDTLNESFCRFEPDLAHSICPSRELVYRSDLKSLVIVGPNPTWGTQYGSMGKLVKSFGSSPKVSAFESQWSYTNTLVGKMVKSQD